jgi:hypothetical protein
MRSTLTRVLAGTAITATALLTVAGTAGATTKAPTTLSIATSKSVIVEGQTVVVSGVLDSGTTPLAGKPVLLKRFYHQKWTDVAAKNTDKNGAVSFPRVPPVGDVIFKLVYFGNAKFAPSHSALAHVLVKPFVRIPTVLSIAESATTIKAGQSVHISGTLTAKGKALADRAIVLLRWNATKKVWVPVRAGETGPLGHVIFTVSPAATAKYELRFFGTKVYAPTHSGVVTVTVTH